ncbi:cytochrome c [Wenzhouxiangella sp. AB-CW3]|uniref:c-type cytochrome n=1 Tax=Wenzhouxiangella sp. AB-CW3 TaxID=2771012 RepID=UPI00168BCF4B|nr:cytochrome c [Wenzhouxiangella sp. AB-CW3]QOC22429.1 cytochrome c [Wenzhouxiangella sp. AB-CW3]
MRQLIGLTALAVVVALASATAMAQLSVDDQIKFRQSGYTFMSWNMGRIKAQVVDGDVPYDPAQVQRAADVIAAIANSGMSALYGPGSDEGTGWKPTRLKSEFFEDLDKVGEIAGRFIEEANSLQEVAASEDPDAIASQFNNLARACGTCHDNFRASE